MPTRARCSESSELRLAELLDGRRRAVGPGADRLVGGRRGSARALATGTGVDDFLAFATSAVRDAAEQRGGAGPGPGARPGIALGVLSGSEEARLTFLAVRRWFGWSAGRLLCLDIGGGSLELAAGIDEVPEVAAVAAARRRPADPRAAAR